MVGHQFEVVVVECEHGFYGDAVSGEPRKVVLGPGLVEDLHDANLQVLLLVTGSGTVIDRQL